MAANTPTPLISEETATKKLQTLVSVFSKAKAIQGGVNLIQEAYGDLNENAHTRVLAALLRIKPVRTFFFRFLDRKHPGWGLDAIADADDGNAEVRCFENYLDACVSIGDYRIIIENKVKGACDQPEQIDRYTKTILNQGVQQKNIFVLYITATGGLPSESSFDAAKEILCYSDSCNTGRFVALSYLQDVLPWLYEMLGRNVELQLAESERELFRSGIIQYANFIEGPALLSVREDKDGYEDFRAVVRETMERVAKPLPFLMELCSWTDYFILRQRQWLCRGFGNDESFHEGVSPEERQRVFKILFYNAFRVIVPDDTFYMPVHPSIGDSPEMYASTGLWEEASAMQVDVWCADENSQTYDNAFKSVKSKLEQDLRAKSISREMDYNRHKMLRFGINTFGDLKCIIAFLGGEVRKDMMPAERGTLLDLPCDGEALLRQLKDSAARWCARHHVSQNDERWELWNNIETDDGKGNAIWAHHQYGYVHGWAIQLSENTNECMRAIDVFGTRQKTAEDVFALVEYMMNQKEIFPFRSMRWDGRVYCHFPVPNLEYGQKLLRTLWEWRSMIGAATSPK